MTRGHACHADLATTSGESTSQIACFRLGVTVQRGDDGQPQPDLQSHPTQARP